MIILSPMCVYMYIYVPVKLTPQMTYLSITLFRVFWCSILTPTLTHPTCSPAIGDLLSVSVP